MSNKGHQKPTIKKKSLFSFFLFVMASWSSLLLAMARSSPSALLSTLYMRFSRSFQNLSSHPSDPFLQWQHSLATLSLILLVEYLLSILSLCICFFFIVTFYFYFWFFPQFNGFLFDYLSHPLHVCFIKKN